MELGHPPLVERPKTKKGTRDAEESNITNQNTSSNYSFSLQLSFLLIFSFYIYTHIHVQI